MKTVDIGKEKDLTKIFLRDGLIVLMTPTGGKAERDYQKTAQAFLTGAQIRQHEQLVTARREYEEWASQYSYGYTDAFCCQYYEFTDVINIAVEISTLNMLAGETLLDLAEAYTFEKKTELRKASGLAGFFGKKEEWHLKKLVMSPAFETFINDVREGLSKADFKLKGVKIGKLNLITSLSPTLLQYQNYGNERNGMCAQLVSLPINGEWGLDLGTSEIDSTKDYVLQIEAEYVGPYGNPRKLQPFMDGIEKGEF